MGEMRGWRDAFMHNVGNQCLHPVEGERVIGISTGIAGPFRTRRVCHPQGRITNLVRIREEVINNDVGQMHVSTPNNTPPV